jgi:Na+/H+ antiporter NhaC
MNHDNDTGPRPSGRALLPLGAFFLLYILTFVYAGDLSQMPISVAFLATSAVAVLSSKGRNVMRRIEIFCHGAANNTILLMVVIFILAGAFSGTARAMGAVDATVNIILHLLPAELVTASIFTAACFISMSMGTSCGTIAALTPIAAGLSAQTAAIGLPALVGAVVGGSMFGDNLSFISDTTIVATRTQHVEMKDKFRANFKLVMPVAVIVLTVYIVQGMPVVDAHGMQTEINGLEWSKALPYLVVLLMALSGINVITVLSLGIVLSGIIGWATGGFSLWQWCSAMSGGIVSDMGELIIVSLMAGGLFEIIRFNGGIEWLILKLTRKVHSAKQAEGAIAALTAFTGLCTANNTIALIITGPLAKQIGDGFNLNPKRIASLIDTVSCSVQSILPYGAQLLIAAGLASISPVATIPHLYYPFGLALTVIVSILFGKSSGAKRSRFK